MITDLLHATAQIGGGWSMWIFLLAPVPFILWGIFRKLLPYILCDTRMLQIMLQKVLYGR